MGKMAFQSQFDKFRLFSYSFGLNLCVMCMLFFSSPHSFIASENRTEINRRKIKMRNEWIRQLVYHELNEDLLYIHVGVQCTSYNTFYLSYSTWKVVFRKLLVRAEREKKPIYISSSFSIYGFCLSTHKQRSG